MSQCEARRERFAFSFLPKRSGGTYSIPAFCAARSGIIFPRGISRLKGKTFLGSARGKMNITLSPAEKRRGWQRVCDGGLVFLGELRRNLLNAVL